VIEQSAASNGTVTVWEASEEGIIEIAGEQAARRGGAHRLIDAGEDGIFEASLAELARDCRFFGHYPQTPLGRRDFFRAAKK